MTPMAFTTLWRERSVHIVSCSRMSALLEPSGECLRGEVLVWLIVTVVYSLTAYRGSNCSLAVARAMDGTIGSCRSTATSMIVKRGWSGYSLRRAI